MRRITTRHPQRPPSCYHSPMALLPQAPLYRCDCGVDLGWCAIAETQRARLFCGVDLHDHCRHRLDTTNLRRHSGWVRCLDVRIESANLPPSTVYQNWSQTLSQAEILTRFFAVDSVRFCPSRYSALICAVRSLGCRLAPICSIGAGCSAMMTGINSATSIRAKSHTSTPRLRSAWL